MKKTKNIWFYCSCLIIFTFFITVPSASAGDTDKLSTGEFAKLVRGGILYDNWMNELGVKVDKTHPSYPATGKKKGKSTWRCKECHGWDYKGKAGAYSKGSHYTDIKGIRAYANKSPDKIVKILKDDTHAFGDMIPDNDLEALALFVHNGQVDMDPYIDSKTKKSAGDPKKGSRIFVTTCIKCHGKDGKEINFKDEKKPEYMGTLANKNPWETLHKIRFGHPDSQMLSLLFLGLQDQLDVLAYCQTLPKK